MPADGEDKIGVACSCILSIFKNASHSSSEEIRQLKQENEDLQKKLSVCQKKNQQQAVEIADSNRRMKDIRDELQTAKDALKRAQTRNEQLEKLRETILRSAQDPSLGVEDCRYGGDPVMTHMEPAPKNLIGKGTKSDAFAKALFGKIKKRKPHNEWMTIVEIINDITKRKVPTNEGSAKVLELLGLENQDLQEEFARLVERFEANDSVSEIC
ncbi:hypothetical protein GNI_075020 [Gregarina niphandrodes]|uniref:Uncharacterized protein n=1 Tax=Gregarina niphandrodes TaxID=110365 RepID=A0A023B6V4_GRENI|nr:hypothetical protein GNI_075020 [Gregarina niphandrodes]EZG66842.1 hypothetical protein GNI_075020 [Gregarina niphandrodes]|eukprot:XP_011130464.1 hypothetical protein GNI_075020 [Gregarina niphandrodes]